MTKIKEICWKHNDGYLVWMDNYAPSVQCRAFNSHRDFSVLHIFGLHLRWFLWRRSYGFKFCLCSRLFPYHSPLRDALWRKLFHDLIWQGNALPYIIQITKNGLGGEKLHRFSTTIKHLWYRNFFKNAYF